MKKTLIAALAALALLAVSQQQAAAWHKCNFGIGLNIGCEGGGNSVLWGVLQGANVPGGYGGGYGGHGGPAFDPGMMPSPNYPHPSGPSPEQIPGPTPGKRPSGNAVPVNYQTQSWYPSYYPYYGYYPNYGYYSTYYGQ